MNHRFLMVISAALLTSCGEQKSSAPATTEPPAEATASSQPTPPAAATAGEIADDQARLTLATLAAPYNAADLANGRSTFATCRACHTLKQGGPRLTGPNLWGLFGRKVGSKEGFTYSPAVRDADFIWDTANLDRWLDNPKQFLPGNKMVFNGIKDADDRRDVIAYVATQTQAPPAP